MPITVAAWSKAWICGRWIGGFAGSNPVGTWISVSLWMLCVLSGSGICLGLITRPEESSWVWCVWMWSWSLDSEPTPARWGGGLLPHGGVGYRINHGADWILLTQAEEGTLAFVNTVVNLRVLLDAGNTSTTAPSLSLLQGTLLGGVGIWVKGKLVPLSVTQHVCRSNWALDEDNCTFCMNLFQCHSDVSRHSE